ncbi:MAG TPA: nodulation protein NfeD [Thermoplasmatales archaeon]|nr:nodulation protein NfeD [Thermoplasmatales archaeon]
MKKLNYLVFLFILFLFSSFLAQAESKTVLVAEIDGPITQATVELVEESIDYAESRGLDALIFTIDTPGGGLDETHKIVELIEQSNVPIIGYVYPTGATAWSAGTFVLLSTDIAVMKNHTVIGSCQPVEVTMTGSRPINESKYINALTEWIRSIAAENGRNASVAEKFITENLNLNASNALKYNVIEFISPSINTLLLQIDGTHVKGKILATKDAKIEYYSPSPAFHLVSVLSNPALSSILLIIAIFSIIFGIHTPGHGAEVFGVIALILALIGMGFSVPVISAFFLIVGFVLIIIEIFITPGFGFIGTGGIIAILLGSILLVPSYSNMRWLISSEYQNILLIFAIVPTILIAAFFVFALYKVIKIRKKKPVLNVFNGEKAETLDEITPTKTGYVRYRGEYWLARSSEGRIPARKEVIIEKKEGPILIVRKSKD